MNRQYATTDRYHPTSGRTGTKPMPALPTVGITTARYLHALVNFSGIASALWTTEATIRQLGG